MQTLGWKLPPRWQQLKEEYLVINFHAFGDARGMMSTATKVCKDLIQMEDIQVGFCGAFVYDSFLTFYLFLLNKHHWKLYSFTKAKRNICSTHLMLTMGCRFVVCFIDWECSCFVWERRIWPKTFCCVIWELAKLEILSASEIFTNPNKTQQNCNQVKKTWLQMATFSRQIHGGNIIRAVVKSS